LEALTYALLSLERIEILLGEALLLAAFHRSGRLGRDLFRLLCSLGGLSTLTGKNEERR
jgi:hypothetical protein